MTPLYLHILLGSLSIPMLFSIFKIDFIKNWKKFTISTLAIAAIFIIWDVYFTKKGFWGFNYDYCLNIDLIGLPIEEWLFFIIIPFCSIFTHYAIFYAFPDLKISKKATKIVTWAIIAVALLLAISFHQRSYTMVNFIFVALISILTIYFDVNLQQRFLVSFVVILIPFFLVNGLLTGMGTPSPIVWYDNTENLGIRLITIPVEDIGYAYTMLLGNLLIFEKLKN